MPQRQFQAVFSDIGGVLATNGWDGQLRKDVAGHFGLAIDDVDSRHHLMFDSFERGYIDFEEYLRAVFFNQPRNFSLEDVRTYTYNASVAWPENIDLLRRIKKLNGLKLALISNEGQGIADHRIRKFGLRDVADFMVISHFVHLRKPDREIWQLALDLAQITAEEAIYIDDREMFVGIAAKMGFTAIHHTSLELTRERFQALGLRIE